MAVPAQTRRPSNSRRVTLNVQFNPTNTQEESTMRITKALRLVSALLTVVTLNLYSGAAAMAAEKIVQSVELKVPATCSQNEVVTVDVTIRVKARTSITVTLWEKDYGRDDKIGSQTVDPPVTTNPFDAMEAREKTVTFKFRPARFERGKNIELSATARDTKSAVVRMRCK
jgi:hypothetical protein